MKLVVDMFRDDFVKALNNEAVKESVKFYLQQEYSYDTTIDDFLKEIRNKEVVEIMDTIEFDVDENFSRLLDRYNIPYSMFVLVDEDNEEDDVNSVLDAKEIFNDLDVYSEYQSNWV